MDSFASGEFFFQVKEKSFGEGSYMIDSERKLFS